MIYRISYSKLTNEGLLCQCVLLDQAINIMIKHEQKCKDGSLMGIMLHCSLSFSLLYIVVVNTIILSATMNASRQNKTAAFRARFRPTNSGDCTHRVQTMQGFPQVHFPMTGVATNPFDIENMRPLTFMWKDMIICHCTS